MRLIVRQLAAIGTAVLGACSVDASIVDPDHAALSRVTPGDGIQFLTQIAQVHAFPVHLADATVQPCEYTGTAMRPRNGDFRSYQDWSYSQLTTSDIIEGRKIFGVIAGIPQTGIMCVAYSSSASSPTPGIKREMQDVVTAFEGLEIRQRRLLNRG